ncbi:MAG: DUF934 domain-containing protein [Myxococcota bacterium]
MGLLRGNGIVTDDEWTIVRDEEGEAQLPNGPVAVTLGRWRAQRDALLGRGTSVGVILAATDCVGSIVEDLGSLELVCVDFPKFTDGRGYSHARLLRDRYRYKGEVRAIGDVLRDQLFFMKRCGFDAFQVRDDKDVEDALAAFGEFSVTYQADAEGRRPIYRHG